MGIFNIFNQAKATFDKAALAKSELHKAELLAQTKHFREAVEIAEKIIADWSLAPSFGEQLTRQIALGDILTQVQKKLTQWRKPIAKANKLAAKARLRLEADQGNPLETDLYYQALTLFKQCITLIYDHNFTKAINECEQEIIQRQQFQSLIIDADNQAKQLFFKNAFNIYNQAKELYETTKLTAILTDCLLKIKFEETYESALQQVNKNVTEGKLKSALSLLKLALAKFPRSDGMELHQQLQLKLKGKEQFRAGLIAEKNGNLSTAINCYREALNLLPESMDCRIRLAIVEIKTNNFNATISLLQGIDNPQANYIRGFAYTQLGNLQQAHREWKNLLPDTVSNQREILKLFAQRDRLLKLKEIEEFVDGGKMPEAKTASLEFMQKFSVEPLVQKNLEEHIQPRLDKSDWYAQDWSKIAENAEQVWLEKQDITSLHNWAVAAYYQAQIDQTKLADFIVIWATSLANINIDTALKNIPWIADEAINFQQVATDLKQLLEETIDAIKDKDRDEYLRLRDQYRLEITGLKVMGNPPKYGMKVKDLFLTPGCYQRYREQLQKITFPAKLWGTLYTDWGLAVAACLEGDTARAIEIKPDKKCNSDVERLAISFISYHEGCHHLQNQCWREAINPLKIAQAEIKANADWWEEVDRLCSIQRKSIYNLNEHLDFARFWYDLLESNAAKHYLAEYKAEQIRERLANEDISYQRALRQLEEIKEIDPENPVLLDLISNIQLSYELQEIEQLFQNRQLSEMVRRAQKSSHERVRYIVAEFFIDKLIHGINNGDLDDPEEIRQLGMCAYEICPNEPVFQEVYQTLGLI